MSCDISYDIRIAQKYIKIIGLCAWLCAVQLGAATFSDSRDLVLINS